MGDQEEDHTLEEVLEVAGNLQAVLRIQGLQEGESILKEEVQAEVQAEGRIRSKVDRIGQGD
jgi:hypothetical protein